LMIATSRNALAERESRRTVPRSRSRAGEGSQYFGDEQFEVVDVGDVNQPQIHTVWSKFVVPQGQ
jgi:hypothetical protein